MLRGLRGDVDDVAIPLRDHVRQDGLRHEKRAGEIGVEHQMPIALRTVDNLAADAEPGVVDEDVDAAEAFLYVGHQPHDIGLFPNVACRSRAPGGGGDVHAFSREGVRDGFADATAAAGHDGGLAP